MLQAHLKIRSLAVKAATVATLFLTNTAMLAQGTTSLRGTVTDSSGAAVPDVVITLADPGTSAARKVLADDQGNYAILQVAPGAYMLKAEKPGFSVMSRQVTLQVNTHRRLQTLLWKSGRWLRQST